MLLFCYGGLTWIAWFRVYVLQGWGRYGWFTCGLCQPLYHFVSLWSALFFVCLPLWIPKGRISQAWKLGSSVALPLAIVSFIFLGSLISFIYTTDLYVVQQLYRYKSECKNWHWLNCFMKNSLRKRDCYCCIPVSTGLPLLSFDHGLLEYNVSYCE